MTDFINPAPLIYERKASHAEAACSRPVGPDGRELIDALEVFELELTSEIPVQHIRDLKDPEHPYTLEQLNVVSADSVEAEDLQNRVKVRFTPTVQHCTMATLIGLCIRVKLMQVLPQRFKVDVTVAPGSHSTEDAVNKQLNDKERISAALENVNLLKMIRQCL